MDYKALPISFFETLKTQKNAKIESEDIIPFQFSKKVLEGERKVVVTLPTEEECVE